LHGIDAFQRQPEIVENVLRRRKLRSGQFAFTSASYEPAISNGNVF